MKKIILLIPVFNDWDSLKKLLNEINKNLAEIKNFEIDCLVINDASTVNLSELKKPKYLNSLKIMNMRKNKGHARCNAFGIRYVIQNLEFDYIILMDGDGEDRPVEIKSLISKIIEFPNYSVVAKRVKRSEGYLFQLLYKMHKLITYIFTGKKINFGNYSCLTRKDALSISNSASLWSSYSGTVKKNIKNFKEIDSIRGVRYFGPSKMSLFKLLIHSFSIIAVFKHQVFLRSIFIIIILAYLNSTLGIFSIFLAILIVIFNLLIFVISKRESEKHLINSHQNLSEVKEIAH